MMSNPGEYRNRISIGDYKTERDPVNKQNRKIFSVSHECWAAIIEPTIRQSFNAAVERADTRIFFRMRYTQSLKKGMIVSFEGLDYEIDEVKPDMQKKKETVIRCKGGVPSESI